MNIRITWPTIVYLKEDSIHVARPSIKYWYASMTSAEPRESRAAAFNLMEDALDACQQAEEMTTSLRKREEQLQTFADQLEQLVKERTQELVQSRDSLRALAQQVGLAEQYERKRLATELHDHLQQMLVLLRSLIVRAASEACVRQAEERD